MSDEIDFSHVNTHKVPYKLMLWYLIGMVKHSQSSQNIKFAMSLQYLQKQVWDEVDFLHEGEHQSFLQVYFNTLVVKVSFQLIPYLFKLLKLTSLQYLYYISKKKLGKKFIFASRYTSKFLKAGIILMELTRNVPSSQNRKLVICLQYLKKKVLQLLFCSILMQNVQMFWGNPIMFLFCYSHFVGMNRWNILWNKRKEIIAETSVC